MLTIARACAQQARNQDSEYNSALMAIVECLVALGKHREAYEEARKTLELLHQKYPNCGTQLLHIRCRTHFVRAVLEDPDTSLHCGRSLLDDCKDSLSPKRQQALRRLIADIWVEQGFSREAVEILFADRGLLTPISTTVSMVRRGRKLEGHCSGLSSNLLVDSFLD